VAVGVSANAAPRHQVLTRVDLPFDFALVRTALMLTLRPPKLSRSCAQHLTEMTSQVALVGEACGERNFRQSEIGAGQHVLGSFDTPLHEIVMRCDTGRLLELSREMKYR
jgi:hypothetical protein